MKTLALRFGETFSPECGTIATHQQVIDEKGCVWWGKTGASVSKPKMENYIKSLPYGDRLALATSQKKTAC